METYQIALVILLIGCVAALFFIWFKNRQASESQEQAVEETVYPSEPTWMPPRPVVDPVPVVEIPENVPSNQHTVYAFEREVQVYVCPRCDGENSVSRQICCICGCEFRKGVW